MAHFIKNGNAFSVAANEALDIHSTLPVGNYIVKQNPLTKQFFLEKIDGFEIKGKVYGDTIRNTRRVLNTFEDRPATTGIMLAGEKGSGKSLLAKMISAEGAKKGYPTIVINAPWCGDEFNAFMQQIDQPTIILFDEFEKVYDRDDQESILTLLDGVFPSKKLFVLTCNDKFRIDSHMRNRPGRIFYMLDFKGLESDFITEYCEDNLNDTKHIPQIIKIAMMFDQFNFDMLKALIEEMNRYGETPQEAMKMLNAKPEFGGDSRYAITLAVDGVEITKDKMGIEEWSGNPLGNQIRLDYKAACSPDVDADGWTWEDAVFRQTDLKEIDPNGEKFVFVNGDGDRITLTRVKDKSFNYFAF